MRPSVPPALRRRSSGDPRLSRGQASQFSRAMEESFRAQWRSGPVSVIIHSLTLLITYALIARAIESGGLSFGYFFLPWIVEYLLVAWGGVLLARTCVKDPIFCAISGRISVALGWTIALMVPYGVVLVWQALFGLDPEAGSLAAARGRLVDSGIAWACVAVTVGLLVNTFRDISVWRVSGGPFVWPATHRFSFRIAALLTVCLATPFVLWLLAAGSSVLGRTEIAGEARPIWLPFGVFLVADLLVLVVGTWLHQRDVRSERLAASSEAET